ncbi:MAG: hypothetical protein ACTSY1_10770 [Alphaproteobacteria bacterium]
MLSNPSLTTRIAIGKMVGLVFGIIGFANLPYIMSEPDLMLRWGVLFWYTTMGAIIGVFGVYSHHPVFNFPMPWWCRAPMIGAWLNFVLTLFVYDRFESMLVNVFGRQSWLTSPWLLVLDGAIAGIIIGYLATRFGGQGRETVAQ